MIEERGAGVVGWKVGQRVGVGWFGGNCGHCDPCRRGDLMSCRNMQIPGITCDGGYAEAMVARASALVVAGVGAEPIQVSALDRIGAQRALRGHASGIAMDSEDTLDFSVLSGVRARIEQMPLEQANEAYARMMVAEPRFRMVLTTGS